MVVYLNDSNFNQLSIMYWTLMTNHLILIFLIDAVNIADLKKQGKPNRFF